MFDPAARPGSVCRWDQQLKIEGAKSHVRRVPEGLAQIRRKERTRDGWLDEFVVPPRLRRVLGGHVTCFRPVLLSSRVDNQVGG